ncbi:MAG: inorganic phosphate transporter [Methanomicrobiales archaeon]|nr:inorganic phosphate transporter [Methanomicrobiales archaeon]
MSALLIPGILLALLFNFVNGLNGAANSIATVVATRTLPPFRAIVLAAVFNFLGPLLFTAAIARTLGEGILHVDSITPSILVVAILSSAVLLVLATISALPISSTHTLVGGLIGAGIAIHGLQSVILPHPAVFQGLLLAIALGAMVGVPLFFLLALTFHLPCGRTMLAGFLVGVSLSVPFLMITGFLSLSGFAVILVFIFISPTLGFLAAFFFDILISYLFRYSHQNVRRKIFRPLQVIASAFQATSHGAHDGQHAVAIITTLLLVEGLIPGFFVPLWVTIASALAIGLGTLFGGWNVIERVAKRITRIRPYQGFSASVSAGLILSTMVNAGIPVSTTHVINGTIVGVGITRGRSAVQWGVFRTIIAGWLITIPLAIFVSWVLARTLGLLLPAM